MRRRLKVGDCVLSDSRGGWKPGEVTEIYGWWPVRLYAVRFITRSGDITIIYPRRSLRRLTSS